MSIEDPNLEQYTPLPGGEGFQPPQPLASVDEFAKQQAGKAVSYMNTRSLLQRIKAILDPLETRVLVTLKDRSKHGLEKRVKPTKVDPSNRETDWKYPREPKPEDTAHQSIYRYRRVNPPVWARWRPTRHGIKRADFNVFFYKGKTKIRFPMEDHEYEKEKIVLDLAGDGEHITSLALTSSFGIWERFIQYPQGMGYRAPKVYTNALMQVLGDRYEDENFHKYGPIGIVYNLGDAPSVEFSRDNYFSNVTEKVLITRYEFDGVNNNFPGRNLWWRPRNNLTGGSIKAEDFLMGLAGAVQLFDPTKIKYYTLRQQLDGEAK